jgi:hypothetical protein
MAPPTPRTPDPTRAGVLCVEGLRGRPEDALTATVRAVQAYDSGSSTQDTVVAIGCVGRSLSDVAAHSLARRLRRRGHRVTVIAR